MHIYEAICSYICVCVCVCECNTCFPDTYLYIYLGVYTHMYVCMYVCIHTHMNIYMTTSYAHRTHDDHHHRLGLRQCALLSRPSCPFQWRRKGRPAHRAHAALPPLPLGRFPTETCAPCARSTAAASSSSFSNARSNAVRPR